MEFLNNETVATVLAAILATQGVAQVIVNATDTPKDDKIVGKVYAVIEKVAGVIAPEKVKQFPGEAEDNQEAA